MPSSDNELLNLCGKVRDGDITPDELHQLESRLLQDPAALKIYREFMAVCSGLEQTAAMQASSDERRQFASEIDQRLDDHRPPRRAESKKRRVSPRKVRHREISIAVAGVTLATALVVFTMIRPGGPSGLGAPGDSETSFAVVQGTHQPAWNGENPLKTGSNAEAGEYRLASGAVQLNYESGAELLVQAPARFELIDAKRVRLTSGIVSLYIPPAATGFRIDTPYGSAVDHGTRIGVTANDEAGLELHVFEGKAELVPANADASTMLTAGEAARLDIDQSVTETIAPRQELFASSIDTIADLPIVSGDVELRISPPPSVRRVHADLVSRGRATVFAEQKAVTLESDIKVTTTTTGVVPEVDSARETLAAGTVVDSFFVHLVLTKPDWRSDQIQLASGTLTFERPILAVITSNPAKTRDQFGNPATEYPGDRNTGLESTIEGNAERGDQLTISPDGKTLSFSLQVHGKDRQEVQDRTDQLRILVAAHTQE